MSEVVMYPVFNKRRPIRRRFLFFLSAATILVLLFVVIGSRHLQRGAIKYMPSIVATHFIHNGYLSDIDLALLLYHDDFSVSELALIELRQRFASVSRCLCCELFADPSNCDALTNEIEIALSNQDSLSIIFLSANICSMSTSCPTCHGIPETLVNADSIAIRAGTICGQYLNGGLHSVEYFAIKLKSAHYWTAPDPKLQKTQRDLSVLLFSISQRATETNQLRNDIDSRQCFNQAESQVPILVRAWHSMESGLDLDSNSDFPECDEVLSLNSYDRAKIAELVRAYHARRHKD